LLWSDLPFAISPQRADEATIPVGILNRLVQAACFPA
jgi:hypothetical protein